MATVTAVKISRRQKLDEEYKTLLLPDSEEPLCFYGPSLITVIFNAKTIVDATLFFICGAHNRYTFIPSDDNPHVLDAVFSKPRIPSFFEHLLPEQEGPMIDGKKHHPRAPGTGKAQDDITIRKHILQKARKRCAFFNIKLSRERRHPTEPAVVVLSGDIKLFNGTVHVCGLRDPRDADMIMKVIHQALVDNQLLLDSLDPKVLDFLSGGSTERRAFLSSNKRCCTLPLVISQGDVVMTNICGRYAKILNLRGTYTLLKENYPAVLPYLTTMSKSNYLAITLFEHYPFNPVRNKSELTEEEIESIEIAKHSYLMSGKKVARPKVRKHTFFIHSSGRFIQSSRNNATSLLYTETCMRLLHTIATESEHHDEEDEEIEEEEEEEI